MVENADLKRTTILEFSHCFARVIKPEMDFRKLDESFIRRYHSGISEVEKKDMRLFLNLIMELFAVGLEPEMTYNKYCVEVEFIDGGTKTSIGKTTIYDALGMIGGSLIINANCVDDRNFDTELMLDGTEFIPL